MDQLMGLPPGGLLSIVIGTACLAAIILLYVKLQGILDAVLHGASAERSALADVLSRLASQMEQLVQLQQEAVTLLKAPPAAPCVASSASAVYEDQRDPADERIQQEAAQLHLDDSAAKALRRRQEAAATRQDQPGRGQDDVSGSRLVAAATIGAAGAVGAVGAGASGEAVEMLPGEDLLVEEPMTAADSYHHPLARSQQLEAEVPPLQHWDAEVSAAPWFTQTGSLSQLDQLDQHDQRGGVDTLGQPAQSLHDLDLDDLVHDEAPEAQPPAPPAAQAQELLWEDESEAFSTQLGGEDLATHDNAPGASDAAHLDAPAFDASLDDDIWDQAPASLGSTMGSTMGSTLDNSRDRAAGSTLSIEPADGSAGNVSLPVNLDDINVMDSMTFEETTVFNGQFPQPAEQPASAPVPPIETPAPAQSALPDFDDEPLIFEAPEFDDEGTSLAPEFGGPEQDLPGYPDHPDLDFRLDDEEHPDELAADLLEALPDDLGAVYGEDLEAAGEYIADETGGVIADDPDSRTWEFGDDPDLADSAEFDESGESQALSPPTAQDLHQDLAVGHAGPVYRDAMPARETPRPAPFGADLDDDTGVALDFDLALPEGLEPLPDDLGDALQDDQGEARHNIMAKLMEDGVPASVIPAPPAQGRPGMASDAHVLDAALEEEISFDEEFADHDAPPRDDLATGPAAGADEPMYVMEEDGELVLDFEEDHPPVMPEAQADAVTAALDDDDLLFDMPDEAQPPAPSAATGQPSGAAGPAPAVVDASAYEDDLLFLDDEEELAAPGASQPVPPELEVDFGIVEFEEAEPEPAQGVAAGLSQTQSGDAVEDVLVFVEDDVPETEAMTALYDSGDLLEFEPDLLEPATPAAMTAHGEALDQQLEYQLDHQLPDLVSFEPTIMPDPDRRGLGPMHEDPLERDIAALEDMISFDDAEEQPASKARGTGRRTSNITDFIEE